MVVSKFGKRSRELIEIKKSYFEDNDRLCEQQKSFAKVYAKQPLRENCKLCEKPLTNVDFSKDDSSFHFCIECGHMNGGHEDTDEFCSAVYTDNKGSNYAKFYKESDRKFYNKRVAAIYTPKVDFLFKSLKNEGLEPKNLRYADIGAGSGYFVAALQQAGCVHTKGYEVSESQVSLANHFLKSGSLVHHGIADTASIASSLDVDVVSMIGVLEHIQNPNDILNALINNPNVKYIYVLIPMFSFSVFMEMVFPLVMPRQLAAGHTHLYTKSSLEWTEKKYKLSRVGE